ncbi:MAG: N-acetyltransferase [Rhodospirillales bacterium]|nr:N-acetyltransferase [Rhodospirillales bacterium]
MTNTANKSTENIAPRVRPAEARDIASIQGIYAHHVRHGMASFEEIPPDVAEIARRWKKVIERSLPYLVAESDGLVVGFAYANLFRERSAYRFALENSVYVAPRLHRRGIGGILLNELIKKCEAAGYRQMIAVIGDSANTASIALHKKMGFEMAGTLPGVGFKFDRWVDSVYMRRPLGTGENATPKEIATPHKK